MKKHSLRVSFTPLIVLFSIFFANPVSASFEDVDKDASYREAVDYLELQGALDPGTDFRPNDYAKRSEFFKMLFKIFEESSKPSGKSFFSDVSTDAWFAPYAELALKYDLVDAGLFEPGKPVRRVEVLDWLMHAYGLSAPIIPMSSRTQLFTDVQVENERYSLIRKAVDEGIIDADANTKFFPYKRLTRGELADLIYVFEKWHTSEMVQTSGAADFYKSDIFADIWNRIINDFYLTQNSTINQEALFQVAVKAVLESLNDPYTKYFDSEAASSFMQVLTGEVEGIGAILLQDEASLAVYVAEILADTPAAESGLEIGDQITAVDGVSVLEMTLENVMSRIRGPADTEVLITVLREDEDHTYSITRALLTVDTVSGSVYKKDYWLIEIDSFGENIYEDMMGTLETLKAELEKPHGIILDLRGNPGGYVNMANFVAGLFVPQLTPLVTLDYGGHEETIYNGDIGPYQGIPLYILVDEFTASASEILTLTLRESADATVIGTQTFGKGTAQEITTYWDGSLFKMTVAEWLSSEGNSVQGIGVTPDILIEVKDEAQSGTSTKKDLWMRAVSKLLD